MREFTMISPTLWEDGRFKELPDDDARYLYLYYYTNRHQNSAGCYRLTDGYAVDDLNWSALRYRATRDVLVSHGLIIFDGRTSEVLIVGWFDQNPPMNEKHKTGASRLAAKISSPDLRINAEAALEKAWDSRRSKSEALVTSVRNRYASGR